MAILTPEQFRQLPEVKTLIAELEKIMSDREMAGRAMKFAAPISRTGSGLRAAGKDLGIPDNAYPGLMFVRTLSPDGRSIMPVAEVVVLTADAEMYGLAPLSSGKLTTMRLDPDHLPLTMSNMIGGQNV